MGDDEKESPNAWQDGETCTISWGVRDGKAFLRCGDQEIEMRATKGVMFFLDVLKLGGEITVPAKWLERK